MNLFLAVEVAKAEGEQGQYLGTLHRLLNHLAKDVNDLGIGDRFLQVILAAKDEMDREHASLGGDGRGICSGRENEIDIAGADFCSICGSWPSCAPGNWSMIIAP